MTSNATTGSSLTREALRSVKFDQEIVAEQNRSTLLKNAYTSQITTWRMIEIAALVVAVAGGFFLVFASTHLGVSNYLIVHKGWLGSIGVITAGCTVAVIRIQGWTLPGLLGAIKEADSKFESYKNEKVPIDDTIAQGLVGADEGTQKKILSCMNEQEKEALIKMTASIAQTPSTPVSKKNTLALQAATTPLLRSALVKTHNDKEVLRQAILQMKGERSFAQFVVSADAVSCQDLAKDLDLLSEFVNADNTSSSEDCSLAVAKLLSAMTEGRALAFLEKIQPNKLTLTLLSYLSTEKRAIVEKILTKLGGLDYINDDARTEAERALFIRHLDTFIHYVNNTQEAKRLSATTMALFLMQMKESERAQFLNTLRSVSSASIDVMGTKLEMNFDSISIDILGELPPVDYKRYPQLKSVVREVISKLLEKSTLSQFILDLRPKSMPYLIKYYDIILSMAVLEADSKLQAALMKLYFAFPDQYKPGCIKQMLVAHWGSQSSTPVFPVELLSELPSDGALMDEVVRNISSLTGGLAFTLFTIYPRRSESEIQSLAHHPKKCALLITKDRLASKKQKVQAITRLLGLMNGEEAIIFIHTFNNPSLILEDTFNNPSLILEALLRLNAEHTIPLPLLLMMGNSEKWPIQSREFFKQGLINVIVPLPPIDSEVRPLRALHQRWDDMNALNRALFSPRIKDEIAIHAKRCREAYATQSQEMMEFLQALASEKVEISPDVKALLADCPESLALICEPLKKIGMWKQVSFIENSQIFKDALFALTFPK